MSSETDRLTIDGSGQSEPQNPSLSGEASGLQRMNAVQVPLVDEVSSSALDAISPLGENSMPVVAEVVIRGSDQSAAQSPTFWSLTAAELLSLLQSKIPALKIDFLESAFISFELSTKNLLEMITVETKADIFSAIGINPTQQKIKALLLENFLIAETISDSNVPSHIREYWASYKTSKFAPMPVTPRQIPNPFQDNSQVQSDKQFQQQQ
jgi:hypothetical protein